MFNKLPREIIIFIINHLEDTDINDDNIFFNIEIQFILDLRLINKEMDSIISSLENSWKYIPYKKYSIDYSPLIFTNIDDKYIETCRKRSYELNHFCNITTPQKTFKWLMDNNIFFSLINICELIKYNRIDILRLGFHYADFLSMLFNRFYMNNETNIEYNDLFNSNHSLNPIIVAAENNHVNIIKILLETCSIGNPFIKEIPRLFDISIKNCYKKLLNYIIIYHYDKIDGIINNKISKIIHRFKDCEDILFYLIINNKIKISQKLLESCIIKGYNCIFIHIYHQYIIKINYNNLIKKTIDYNNYTLFTYLVTRTPELTKDIITKLLFRKGKSINKVFLENIISHHLELILKDSNIIKLSIEVGVTNELIFRLIDNNYEYNIDGIYKSFKKIMDDNNIELLKYLVNNI